MIEIHKRSIVKFKSTLIVKLCQCWTGAPQRLAQLWDAGVCFAPCVAAAPQPTLHCTDNSCLICDPCGDSCARLLKFPPTSQRSGRSEHHKVSNRPDERIWLCVQALIHCSVECVCFLEKSKWNLTNTEAQSSIWTMMGQTAVQSKQQFTC